MTKEIYLRHSPLGPCRSHSVEQLTVRHSNCFFCDNFKNLLKTHLFIQSYYTT